MNLSEAAIHSMIERKNAQQEEITKLSTLLREQQAEYRELEASHDCVVAELNHAENENEKLRLEIGNIYQSHGTGDF